MKLYYFYSDSCGSCKGYSTTVDKLATELKITPQKQNIDEIKPLYKLDGIPTIILTDDDGNEIWRSVGNVAYNYVITEINQYIK